MLVSDTGCCAQKMMKHSKKKKKKQGAPLNRTHPEKSTYDRNSSVITTLEFLVGAGGLRKPPGRSCSHPPAYVSLTFAQKKTASVSLHQRFFHGRGWITQAAHLKRPRRGLFAAGTYSGGRCCSNPPLRRFTNFQIKQKLQCHYNTGVLGGRGWIRTTEAEKQQIYSLSPLATREHAHIQFFAVADCLYILPLGGVFVNCFLQLFQKRS